MTAGVHVGSSEPRSITVTIKVEEPIFLTLDVGKADEAEISDLRVQLSNLHRQLEYSHAQLADNGGVLRTAQEQLAHTHDALSLERQKTKDLTREMTAISKSPLADTSNTADVGFDSEESSQRSRGWADRDGPGNGIGHRATFASTGHSGSGLERAAVVAQVPASSVSSHGMTICFLQCLIAAQDSTGVHCGCFKQALLYMHLASNMQAGNSCCFAIYAALLYRLVAEMLYQV